MAGLLAEGCRPVKSLRTPPSRARVAAGGVVMLDPESLESTLRAASGADVEAALAMLGEEG